MSPAVILLLLRLLAAALLLTFFGIIAWLIYRDIKMTTTVQRSDEMLGTLRIVVDDPKPNQHSQTYPLFAVTKIGRSSNNTIVLDDAFASNEHALIALRNGQWWLEDLGSRNGTLLNDVLLNAPAVITAGDIVVVGRTALELDLEVSKKGEPGYTSR